MGTFTMNNIANPMTEGQTVMAAALKSLLQDIHSEKTIYRATDRTDMQAFGFRLIQKVRKTSKTRLSLGEALKLMEKAWHIKTSVELAALLISERKSLTKLGYKLGAITGSTNRGSSGRMTKREMNQRVNRLSLDVAVKANKRAIVCRSQFGDHDIRFYEITESMTTKKGAMLNAIKMQYKMDTGCPYYQVRPILMSTWMTLPEYLQYCTTD